MPWHKFAIERIYSNLEWLRSEIPLCGQCWKEGRIEYFWSLFVEINGDWDCQEDVWVDFSILERATVTKQGNNGKIWKGWMNRVKDCHRIAFVFRCPLELPSCSMFLKILWVQLKMKVKSHDRQFLPTCTALCHNMAQHLPHSAALSFKAMCCSIALMNALSHSTSLYSQYLLAQQRWPGTRHCIVRRVRGKENERLKEKERK